MTEQLDDIFETFSQLLAERIESKGAERTEEDIIRYLFFYAATTAKDGYEPNDFTLEWHFYPDEPDSELDTHIEARKEKPSCAIEFKYHRSNIETGALTKRAGDVFNDIRRLASRGEEKVDKRLFVYVTNEQMKNYFAGRTSAWGAFFGNFPTMEKGESLTVTSADIQELAHTEDAKTFYDTAGGASFNRDCTVRCVFEKPCGTDTFLYIYEVQEAN